MMNFLDYFLSLILVVGIYIPFPVHFIDLDRSPALRITDINYFSCLPLQIVDSKLNLSGIFATLYSTTNTGNRFGLMVNYPIQKRLTWSFLNLRLQVIQFGFKDSISVCCSLMKATVRTGIKIDNSWKEAIHSLSMQLPGPIFFQPPEQ